jgi:hypothetical protein
MAGSDYLFAESDLSAALDSHEQALFRRGRRLFYRSKVRRGLVIPHLMRWTAFGRLGPMDGRR